MIFDDDFSLSDKDENDFEGRDNIHSFLGETVLRHKDVMDDYMDKENTSKNESVKGNTTMMLIC